MKRIKVLHIVYSLQLGGAERVVTNYALHHNRQVYEPVVVALTQGGPLEDDLNVLEVGPGEVEGLLRDQRLALQVTGKNRASFECFLSHCLSQVK